MGFKEMLKMHSCAGVERFFFFFKIPEKTYEWLGFSAKYDSVGGKVLLSNVRFTEVPLRPPEQRSRP